MPVRITHNIAVELGLAHGSAGTLVGVDFESSTVFESTTLFGMKCLIPDNLPNVAFVSLNAKDILADEVLKTVSKPCPEETIPLIPIQVKNCYAKLDQVKLQAGRKITIKQLPLVPS